MPDSTQDRPRVTNKMGRSLRAGLRRLISLVSLASLAACTSAPGVSLPPAASATPPAASAPTLAVETDAATPTPPAGITLRVWLPPQFDPKGNTPAASVLNARLKQFRAQRPNITLEVRLKAVAGAGGLLDALTTAGAAAPGALPDLVALPRDVLEAAALKGMLHPYNGLTNTLEDNDWFDYARKLGKIQQDLYGLPFAGDALALAYRPTQVATPPTQWSEVITQSKPLVFAAADPQARFTLALYQSLAPALRDDQGRPRLDNALLTQVFTFYAQSESSQAMPEWLTQLQTEDQVWQAYQQGRADMAVVSVGRYLTMPENDAALAGLPTLDGAPFTPAGGWVWGLAARNGSHQAAAIELAEYLTESRFLAEWTSAAGLLPTRPSALKQWENPSLRATLENLARSAQVSPPVDVAAALSGPLWQAAMEVLKGQSEPAVAAQSAAAGLNNP